MCYISFCVFFLLLLFFSSRLFPHRTPREWKQALQGVDQAAGDVVAVGEHPHLQGAVRPAGEDAISGPRLHLHDAGADVAEDGLLGMLVAEGVHEAVAG